MTASRTGRQSDLLFLPAEYGSDVIVKNSATHHPEKYAELNSRNAIKQFIMNAIQKNDPLILQSICEDAHPEIAKTILETIGFTKIFQSVELSFVKADGTTITTHGLVPILETAFLALPYQDAMKLLLNIRKEIPRNDIHYFFDFIKKRMITDPQFEKAFLNDPLYAPLLVRTRSTLTMLFPEIASKPPSSAVENYLVHDICSHLKFKKSALSPEQQDIVNIHLLLTNQDLMLKQLDKLERALNQAIQNRWEEKGMERPPFTPSPHQDHHLFTKPYPKDKNAPFLFSFFQQWVVANHFNKLIRLIDVKSDVEFMMNLKNKILFKDPAFGGIFHGAWTHLIQWYCITTAANDHDIKLHSTPAEILQYIGEHGGKENSLWNATFESPLSDIRQDVDYRSVTESNEYMNNDPDFAKRCPILHELIYYRMLKDEAADDDHTPPSSPARF